MHDKKPPIKKIPKRAEKEKPKDLIYKALRLKFLRENPRCAVFPDLKSCEVHHKKGRGKYYLDVKTWLAVSRKGHQKIEANPEWAFSLGYSESRLKKEDEQI